MNKSETITKIAAALVKAQSEMGNAVKDSKNPFFKSSYADLNSIREVCLPVLNKNGITVLQPTTVVDNKVYVETTLLHESGEFLASLTEILSNKVNDAQAAGSGISYARRYGLQAFLCIGAEDDDGEKAVGRNVTSNKNVTVVKETTIETVPTPAKRGFGIAKATQEVNTAGPVTVNNSSATNNTKTDDWS